MILMSVHDVAGRLAVSVDTVRRIIKRGELRHSRAGIQIRVSEQQLQAYLHREQPSEPARKPRLQTIYTHTPEPNWEALKSKKTRKAV